MKGALKDKGNTRTITYEYQNHNTYVLLTKPQRESKTIREPILIDDKSKNTDKYK